MTDFGDINEDVAVDGSYTPTATSVANVDSVDSVLSHFWIRMGNTVFVSGVMAVDATTAGVLTRVRLSLPVASTFSAAGDCAGAVNSGAGGAGAVVLADTANNEAEVRWFAGSAASDTIGYSFSYQVV